MILALGQSWMVMCAKLSGAMCLADILILTLPNTLTHVMEKADFYIRTSENLGNVGSSQHKLP
jgi:hypothetical protein